MQPPGQLTPAGRRQLALISVAPGSMYQNRLPAYSPSALLFLFVCVGGYGEVSV